MTERIFYLPISILYNLIINLILKSYTFFSVSAITDEQVFEDHTSTKSGKNCRHYVVQCINNQRCNQNCVEPSFFRQIAAASVTKSVEGTV